MLFSKLCRGPKSSDSCRPTVVAAFKKLQDMKEDNKVLRCSRSYVELKRVGDGGGFCEPTELSPYINTLEPRLPQVTQSLQWDIAVWLPFLNCIQLS